MSETKVVSRPIIKPLPLLGIAFIVLKLVGTIDWSWWWITAPFWAPIAIVVGLLLLLMLFFGVAAGVVAVCEVLIEAINKARDK
jgi:hypothetical protein